MAEQCDVCRQPTAPTGGHAAGAVGDLLCAAIQARDFCGRVGGSQWKSDHEDLLVGRTLARAIAKVELELAVRRLQGVA